MARHYFRQQDRQSSRPRSSHDNQMFGVGSDPDSYSAKGDAYLRTRGEGLAALSFKARQPTAVSEDKLALLDLINRLERKPA